MIAYVALLRAVNVGGTGKLPMTELKSMCEAVGFKSVRTYIASGNVVFKSVKSEAQVKAALEAALHPANTNYLYFVADPNGRTKFAATLTEHNANVAAYRAGMKP